MKKTNIILMLFLILALLALGSFYLASIHEENNERVTFVSSLGNISQDAMSIEAIGSILSFENNGGGWFTLNGNDINPGEDIYYLNEPVQASAFASTTGISIEQVNILTNIIEKYPYIDEFEKDTGVLGKCGENNTINPCDAIEFYLKPSLFSALFSSALQLYSSGYMYVPFTITASDQAYLNSHFSSVKEIAPNWYQFSGQSL